MLNDMDGIFNAQEIVQQYQKGARHFEALDIEGCFRNQDLSGSTFDDCCIVGDFQFCNLEQSSFLFSNIKTSDFRYANLHGTTFKGCAVEATQYDWANTEGLVFQGNYCYGQEVQEGDFKRLFKSNKTMPSIRVESWFLITSRGFVITTQEIEGRIDIGDTLLLDGTPYRIAGLELIRKVGGSGTTGIVLPIQEEAVIAGIQAVLKEGQVLEIIKQPEP